MKYITCDKCGREAPPRDELSRRGWYASTRLSISGIPWDLICPICIGNPDNNMNI